MQKTHETHVEEKSNCVIWVSRPCRVCGALARHFWRTEIHINVIIRSIIYEFFMNELRFWPVGCTALCGEHCIMCGQCWREVDSFNVCSATSDNEVSEKFDDLCEQTFMGERHGSIRPFGERTNESPNSPLEPAQVCCSLYPWNTIWQRKKEPTIDALCEIVEKNIHAINWEIVALSANRASINNANIPNSVHTCLTPRPPSLSTSRDPLGC